MEKKIIKLSDFGTLYSGITNEMFSIMSKHAMSLEDSTDQVEYVQKIKTDLESLLPGLALVIGDVFVDTAINAIVSIITSGSSKKEDSELDETLIAATTVIKLILSAYYGQIYDIEEE